MSSGLSDTPEKYWLQSKELSEDKASINNKVFPDWEYKEKEIKQDHFHY